MTKKKKSYPHEVEDTMNDIPCQNFEFHDPSFDDFERVNFEERLVDFPSSHKEDSDLGDKKLVDLFHIEQSKWDTSYFHFESDPIYDIGSKVKDVIDEIGLDEEFNLEMFEEKLTSPSFEEYGVIYPPLHERVENEKAIIRVEHSIPCALEKQTSTLEYPHSPFFPLTHEYSPSLEKICSKNGPYKKNHAC